MVLVPELGFGKLVGTTSAGQLMPGAKVRLRGILSPYVLFHEPARLSSIVTGPARETINRERLDFQRELFSGSDA